MHRPLFIACMGLLAWLQTVRAEPVAADVSIDWAKRYEQAQDLMHDGKAAESVALGEETVALAEKTPGADITAARHELSQLYLLCHRFADAEKVFLTILAEREKAAGGDDIRVAEALYDLGWFYSNMSNYARAEPEFQRALAIDEAKLGRRHSQTALVLNGLGVLYENKGDYDQAEKYFLEALDTQKETIGADTLTAATTLNNLATLYWSRSDYNRAENFFSQALAIRERLRGRGSLVTATTVSNLALVYLGMGDYERAEPLFWRVLRIREHKLGPDHPLTLTVVNHLGLLYYDTGDYKAAESLLQRAAQSREKTIGAEQPDTARALFHLACLYDTTGQYEKAEALHTRALDIRSRVLGPDHPETAASRGFLARHYHLMGRYDMAAPLYEQALAAQKKTLGPDHPDTLKTLENFACLQLDLGNTARAAQLEKEAESIRERQLQNLFLFTSERQRIDFQKTLNFYNLPASIGDAAEIARVIYRTKGVVLDSLVADRLGAGSDPETAALVAKLREVSRKLETGGAPVDAGGGTAAQGVRTREDLEREADRLQAELGARLNRSGNICHALQTDPAAVAAAVPAGAAVVEFIRYGAYQKNLQFKPSYGALVQSAGQPPRWVPLGFAEEIETQAGLYRKYVRRRIREASFEVVLKKLHQQVWQPVEGTLGADCHRAILCPDGDLNYLSFATLQTPDNLFLCEKTAVEYVSSARDLLGYSRDLPVGTGSLAIFAAPSFGGGKGGGAQLDPLPGAEKEAAFLQGQAVGKGWSVELFKGADASEDRLNALQAPTILHLATHGFYRQEKAPVVPASAADGMRGPAIFSSPMRQSMLALAGAQATLDAWQRGEFPAPEQDGILTAAEAGALNLRGTWLVVLSACDSGMGQSQAGEGVLGLRRGFLLAGAANVLMTLWPVGDADSVDFMESFYREAMARGNAASALGDVQKEWLVRTRRENGLWRAVQSGGAFILGY